jgi:hypothetical protein
LKNRVIYTLYYSIFNYYIYKFMKMLNSGLFKRILVIFVVGLVSRSIINYAFGVNVFKECAEFISLSYFGYMISFTVVISELPTITINSLSISSFRSSVRTFYESYYLGVNKMELGEKLGNVSKEEFNKNKLFLTQNTSGKHSSSSRDSCGRSYGDRGSSAGVSGLYGHGGGRTRRPSAALAGLYGNNGDQGSRVSNNSSDTHNFETRNRRYNHVSDIRDRRHHDENVRNRPIRRVFTGNEAEYERVSGFNSNTSNNSNNRTGYRDDIEYNGRNSNSSVSFEYINSNGVRLNNVETFVTVVPNGRGGYVPTGVERNPYYAPSELAISIQGSAAGSVVDQSENLSRVSSVSRENTVPRAPRPSNYSTPETMSPLFPSSEASNRRYYSSGSSRVTTSQETSVSSRVEETLFGVRSRN